MNPLPLGSPSRHYTAPVIPANQWWQQACKPSLLTLSLYTRQPEPDHRSLTVRKEPGPFKWQ
ncbi:hypothetical protein GCM10009425_47900 [Pseudomonas asuensis]|uniref:Uncharacterized protein n=1 Tax=Pseudomonas asuensis TaxID=1825787 RepID=A0ABQ2H4W4_9PSED|nr:hypothetical protein GCM10009425_47900 [Pseudomonas asuensis]